MSEINISESGFIVAQQKRPGWDAHFMAIAKLCSEMSTCSRRSVGCVLVSDQRVILSTGFNGPPRGFYHCTDVPCPGANSKSGTNLDACEAIHAEANALLHCSRLDQAKVCYTTTSPCLSCVKLLIATNISQIIFLEEYPHPEAAERWTRMPLLRLGRAPIAEQRKWGQLQTDGTVKILRSSGKE